MPRYHFRYLPDGISGRPAGIEPPGGVSGHAEDVELADDDAARLEALMIAQNLAQGKRPALSERIEVTRDGQIIHEEFLVIARLKPA